LVIHSGSDRLLIIDNDFTGADTLVYIQLPLSDGTHGIGGWAGGFTGSIGTVKGDAAIDVYWGLIQAYDYYSTLWNWTPSGGFNATGPCTIYSGKLKGYVNTNHVTPSNANANNFCNEISFGLGVGSIGPRISPDVVAHEYSHMVIDMAANTNVETLALNEAFADMMCAAIERHIHLNTGYPIGVVPNYWLVGEQIQPDTGLRSIREPEIQVYGSSDYWSAYNGGKIYKLAGVAERWFYLLVEGGNGTINGSPYNVTGIGWALATEIVYLTMTDKLFTPLYPRPTYTDAVAKSIETANEHFPAMGVSETVQQAWYAVGLLANPNSSCPGVATYVGASGSFTDGSGSANYGNNLDCDWLIKPTGMDVLSVYFTQFNVSAGDTVYIHNGDDATGPVLAKYTGSAVPAQATFNTPSVTVRFLTNTTGNSSGWTLNYTASTTGFCSSATAPFTAPTGSFSDGSGAAPYASNTHCGWYIAPPGATSVTLAFSAFDTEAGTDVVKVYDGLNTTVPPIATYSGSTLPSQVTAPSGSMFVEFISNSTVQGAGWTANYSTTGSANCGNTVLIALNGSFNDGSGANNYQNNSACSWLIQPAGASAVQLEFTAFSIEPPGTYGQVYDAVRVYDGANASAPLLGTFMGTEIPNTLYSSGPSLFVQFATDNATTGAGWAANYTGLTGSTCSGTQVLTAASGSFGDGSGASDYANNSNCYWLIQPEDAVQITLTFDAFATQLNADGVIVYDGPTTSSPVLGTYTGSALPPVLTASGGSMLVRFISDASVSGAGFQAHYAASIVPPGAPAIVGYEYWLDDDDGAASYQTVQPTAQLTLDQDLDISSTGLSGHMLHIRFKYTNGLWSSVLSRPFLNAPATVSGTPELAAMQYWFDDNAGDALSTPLTGNQIDLNTALQTNGLALGGHMLHIRFLGNAGWSSVLSRPFFQGPATTTTAMLDGYEYWFDENPNNAVSASIAPVEQLLLNEVLPTDLLPTGLHVLHIRFHGTGGWSSVLSRPFFRAGSSANLPNLITGYKYWFDDANGNAVDVSLSSPQSPYTLAQTINTGNINAGVHIFHIQFRDLGENWGAVLSQAFTRTPVASVSLPMKVFLDGPYVPATQLMQDSLRRNGLLPLTEPYTNAGFFHTGGGGGESIAPSVLTTTGANAIVDWVLVEIRDPNDNTSVLYTRSALVQRDGDVVDVDGVSPLSLPLPFGSYHVAIRHRNHLGAMTLSTVPLNGSSPLIDFTSSSMLAYGTEARKAVNNALVLWTGEVVLDGVLKYTGQSNDRDPILVRVGGSIATNTVIGYYTEDVTLDGVVKYTGLGNDRDKILVNVGGVIATAVRYEQLP